MIEQESISEAMTPATQNASAGPASPVDAPIGVFDSGVGGLSVLREIRKALPSEDLIYIADSGAAPYGDRPRDFIIERARAIVRFLESRKVKALVVACNTATAVAIQNLRAHFDLPIVAIEPAVKPAVEQTRSGVVGILATRQTIASENFSRLVAKYGGSSRIVVQPCPGLVKQVESGEVRSAATTELVKTYLAPILAQHADTIVLGCTHYPFLMQVIRDIAGPGVSILDPAVAVAKELDRRLEKHGLRRAPGRPGHDEFWTSGASGEVGRVMTQLWGTPVAVQTLPAPYGV